MSTADCTKKCGRDRTAKGGMVVEGKVVLGLVRPENPIGLMGWGGNGNRPKSIVHSTTCDDDFVILDDFDIVPREECGTIIITELGKGDQCPGLQVF